MNRERKKIICFITSLFLAYFFFFERKFESLDFSHHFYNHESSTLNVFVNKSDNMENEDLEKLRIFQRLQARIPNLPVSSLLTKKKRGRPIKFGCSSFPSIFDIEYRNTLWQIFQYKGSTFHLYGAYLDNRTQIHNGPIIRILSMIGSKRFVNLMFIVRTVNQKPMKINAKRFRYVQGVPKKTLFCV